jgi:hypothetical protein
MVIQNSDEHSNREHIIPKTPRLIDIIAIYKIHKLSFPASCHMQSCQAFIDPPNLCGSLSPVISSYPPTLFLRSSSQNPAVWRTRFRCYARCCRAWMKVWLPSCSAISPHHDRVRLVIHSMVLIEYVWSCTWRL